MGEVGGRVLETWGARVGRQEGRGGRWPRHVVPCASSRLKANCFVRFVLAASPWPVQTQAGVWALGPGSSHPPLYVAWSVDVNAAVFPAI